MVLCYNHAIVKVVYYAKYSAKGPSSRYRAFQLADAYRKEGIEREIRTLFDDDYFAIVRMPPSAARSLKKVGYVTRRFKERKAELRNRNGDLAIIEGQLFPYLPFACEKKYLPPRYLVEFDDAIYLTHPSKLPRVFRHATAVLAGNRTLADFASRHNKQVHVVPTVLDTTVFRPLPKAASSKIRIGWSGLEYNVKYVRGLTPVFWKLLKKYPVEFVVLSGSPPENISFPHRFVKWDPAKEAEQIGEFDIGVMPLQMDEWCKGKCGLKLLQYMSLGIPAVATPVGVNSEIIRDGENGYLAVGLEQWEECLSRLIEDADLRKSIGNAGRQTVVERYSTAVWVPRILEIYRQYAK